MKNIVRILLVILVIPLLAACEPDDVAGRTEDASSSETEEHRDVTEVRMRACITALDEKLEVNVIEGMYGASGTYLVIVSDETVYTDADGVRMTREDLAVGMTVEITYGGQVMMSNPPQIVAKSIRVIA